MLTKLTLHNFQAYKKAKVVFDKGVNIIIGKSDSGKSSIIRSIKLLLHNKPSGDNYRKHKTDITKVTGVIDDNKITRERGKSINQYRMNEDVFKAIGSTVPEQIHNVLNVGEENIQSQHEFYFLLDKPSGQVAKSLNEVSDLSIMDSAMQKVKGDLKETSGLITNVESVISNLDNLVKESEWIKDAEKELKKLLMLDESLTMAKNDYQDTERIIEKILALQDNMKNLIPAQAEDKLISIESLLKLKQNAEVNVSVLKKVLDRLVHSESKLDTFTDFDDTGIVSIQKYISSKDNMTIKVKAINDLIQKIEEQGIIIKDLTKDLTELEEEIDAIDNCPICGSEM